MDMFEEAAALSGTLKLRKITQEELAKKLGVSQSYVSNKIRLLQYSEDMRNLIRECGISERHARTVLRLPSETLRHAVVLHIRDAQLNVADTEALVEELLIQCARHPDGDPLDEITKLGVGLDEAIAALRCRGVPVHSEVENVLGKKHITVSIG